MLIHKIRKGALSYGNNKSYIPELYQLISPAPYAAHVGPTLVLRLGNI